MDHFIKYFLLGLFTLVASTFIIMTTIVTLKFMYVFFKDIWDDM